MDSRVHLNEEQYSWRRLGREDGFLAPALLVE